MKKLPFLILFFLLPFFLIPSKILFAQGTNGFMGYSWETDYSVIDSEKSLQWVDEQNGLGFHEGKKDANSNVTVIYVFKKSKLVSGAMYFHNQEAYYTSLKFLQEHLGAAQSDKKNSNLHYWISENTLINYRDGGNRIIFSNLSFTLSQAAPQK